MEGENFTRKQRWTSLLLALVLVLGMFPAPTFAEEEDLLLASIEDAAGMETETSEECPGESAEPPVELEDGEITTSREEPLAPEEPPAAEDGEPSETLPAGEKSPALKESLAAEDGGSLETPPVEEEMPAPEEICEDPIQANATTEPHAGDITVQFTLLGDEEHENPNEKGGLVP